MQWAPHEVCATCVRELRNGPNGRTILSTYKNLCYGENPRIIAKLFFLFQENWVQFQIKKGLKTINVHAVYHEPDIAPPSPPYLESMQIEDLSSDAEGVSQPETDFETSAGPKLFSQSGLNDLTRDLSLPKDTAELLGSRLSEKNMLALGTLFS